MGWILRTKNDVNNPTLPGGVYGKWITIGRGVYYRFDGSRTRYLIFISDGGRYGLDSVDSVEYNGNPQSPTDWIFHPGTLPAQIQPVVVSGIDTATDVLTSNSHPFADGVLVRAKATDGQLPPELAETARYQVSDKTTNTFKLKDETGTTYVDFSSAGTGVLRVWEANAGFDDPVQGIPTFVPEVATTFNNIAYVEGMLPAGVSDAVNPPEWDQFRILGTGRKLMIYGNDGAEVGLGSGDDLSNIANEIADNYIVNYAGKPSRLDYVSLDLLRHAADTHILQTSEPEDEEVATPSFTGRYFYDYNFSNLVYTSLDPLINFDFGTAGSPAPGMPGTNYSIRWTGKIKPTYAETYTFRLHLDDVGKLYIDGNLIIDAPGLGVYTGTYVMEAGRTYDLQLDYQQVTFAAYVDLQWQSASQALTFVPPSADIGTSDTEVRRYECHTAFAVPVEASEVHERLMERVPGWDWTDDNGKISFLPPDRPVAFSFALDRDDDDSRANFVKQSLQKKRRPISDRPNFLLFRYRNVQRTGYPYKFVSADREELRNFTNGEPSNFPAEDLGVSTRSLAERMAEFEMVIKSDPRHVLSVAGGRAASKIRKNELVAVSYYDRGNRKVADERYIATFHAWGERDGRNNFSLLPVPVPIYSDESLVIFHPTDLASMWAVYEPDSYTGSDGSDIATAWEDKTSHGRDAAVSGTPTLETGELNGKSIVRLGADSLDSFTLPSMAALTEGAFYIVLKVTDATTAGGNTLGTSASVDHFPYLDGKIYNTFGSANRYGPLDPVVPILNTWQILWGWSKANDFRLYQNETLLFDSTTHTVGFPAVPIIGTNGTQYMKADIAGIYLQSAKPTDMEISAMLSYIKARNGNFY